MFLQESPNLIAHLHSMGRLLYVIWLLHWHMQDYATGKLGQERTSHPSDLKAKYMEKWRKMVRKIKYLIQNTDNFMVIMESWFVSLLLENILLEKNLFTQLQ